MLSIIYGMLGIISVILFFPSKTFILLFNYIFNTPNIININTLIYINFALLILIIILGIKNIKKNKINYQLLIFFIINTLISLLLYKNIIPLKNIIINLLITIILLFIIKKLKVSNQKDSLQHLIIQLIIVFITKLFNIYNYFIIYFISRLYKLNYKIIKRYLYTIILSDIISFLIINIKYITININLIITFISALITGIYYLFNYYKINYSKLKIIYLLLLIFLLYFFR